MLLAVLLDGYCTGVRSSHQIERRCHEDIAFRILAGNRTPDHVTIARFRVRHEQALAGLLIQSLKLCAAAGLVRLGLVALDGTKIEANAAAANRTRWSMPIGGSPTLAASRGHVARSGCSGKADIRTVDGEAPRRA
jgi:transposase